MLLRDICDFFNLGQFDPINQMIPLIMIPLSRVHCKKIISNHIKQRLQLYI